MKAIKDLIFDIKSLPNKTLILIILNALLGIAQFIVTPYLSLFLYNYRNLTAFEAGLILGISPLISTLLSPINGVFIKKIGYRNALVLGSSGWIIASVIYANAKTLPLFLLATTITGLTGGIENISFTTILSVSVSDKQQEAMFNLNYWILNWTACLGPLIGSFLGGGSNPALFYLVTVTEFISTVIIVWVTKNSHELDRENKADTPKNNKNTTYAKSILKNKKFWLLIIGAMIFLIAYSQLDSNFSLYLSKEYKQGVTLYGRLQSLDGLMAILLQPVIYSLMKKIGTDKGAYLGPLICAITFLIFAIHSEIIIYFAMILLTIGSVMYNPTVSALVSKFATKENRSTVFGIYNLYGIGSFIGPTVGAFIFSNYRNSFLLLIALAFLFCGILFFFAIKKNND